jgi:hypothetical protein
MDDSIKRRGRFHDFIESSRRGDVWNDAKIELRAGSWEVGEDLGGFGLGSYDCADGEAV